MLLTMQAHDIGKIGHLLLVIPFVDQAPLQVSQAQKDHAEPFLRRLVRLQPEVAQAQGRVQVEVIHLARPAPLIPVQYRPHRKGGVGAEEVLRALVPIVPPGRVDADLERDLLDASVQGAHLVCSAGPVCSGHLDCGVPPMPKPRFVVADLLPVQSAIGLERADDVPAVSAAELDQPSRSVPTVKERIDAPAPRERPAQIDQDLPCQPILALEAQALLRGTPAVEPADGLRPQVNPPRVGVAGPRKALLRLRRQLDVALDVSCAVLVVGLLAGALPVVIVPVDRLQVAGLLVLLLQGVIDAHQEDLIQPVGFRQQQEVFQEEVLQWAA